MTLGLREGTHHVQMNGAEPLIRYIELTNPRVNCRGLLGNLTWVTRLDEVGYVIFKARPIIFG